MVGVQLLFDKLLCLSTCEIKVRSCPMSLTLGRKGLSHQEEKGEAEKEDVVVIWHSNALV